MTGLSTSADDAVVHYPHIMRKRTRLSLFVAGTFVALIVAAAALRKAAPPEPARLLPESDAILYLQLSTVRSVTHFDTSPIARSADFQRFIDATGIVPERDLDAVAFALHRMPDPHGPNGVVAYSEVFSGRFDGTRLAQYLASLAAAREMYQGHAIYSVPVEGRTLRITQLGYDTVAASNMPTTAQIHSMVDRYATSGLWRPGSSLLAARFREVPLLSQAWAIGHIGLPFAGTDGRINLLGMELPLAEDTDLVASLRYSGSVHLRIEEFAPNTDTAAHTTAALNGVLTLMRSMNDAQPAATPSQQAMRAIVDSIAIEQEHSRAVLTAQASTDQLHDLTAKP